ncbi:MAG: hypothetical protein ACOYL5_08350 [Phototrophicaceae bacterium]|jgi:hypothetical protein
MALIPTDTLADEVLDFLAASPSAEQILSYTPPQNLQDRLETLLEKNREQGLTLGEEEELNEFVRLDRFMSRLKIKARRRLANL